MNLDSALTIAYDLEMMDGQERYVIATSNSSFKVITWHQLDPTFILSATPNSSLPPPRGHPE